VDADLVARFRDRALNLTTSVEDIASLQDLPAAVARYRAEK